MYMKIRPSQIARVNNDTILTTGRRRTHTYCLNIMTSFRCTIFTSLAQDYQHLCMYIYTYNSI